MVDGAAVAAVVLDEVSVAASAMLLIPMVRNAAAKEILRVDFMRVFLVKLMEPAAEQPTRGLMYRRSYRPCSLICARRSSGVIVKLGFGV